MTILVCLVYPWTLFWVFIALKNPDHIIYSSYGHMVKWGSFQDQYLHPMQVTASLDKKYTDVCTFRQHLKKICYWLLLIIWSYS